MKCSQFVFIPIKYTEVQLTRGLRKKLLGTSQKLIETIIWFKTEHMVNEICKTLRIMKPDLTSVSGSHILRKTNGNKTIYSLIMHTKIPLINRFVLIILLSSIKEIRKKSWEKHKMINNYYKWIIRGYQFRTITKCRQSSFFMPQ